LKTPVTDRFDYALKKAGQDFTTVYRHWQVKRLTNFCGFVLAENL